MTPQLPTKGNFISSVKTSCEASLTHSQIQISDSGIDSFLTNLNQPDFLAFAQEHGLRFPLQFDSDLDELNLICILSILNTLSGYRVPLHRLAGRGAWDTIRYFTFSALLTEPSYISAKEMAGITEAKVAELMNLPLMTEKPHPTLTGVTVGETDPEASEIARLIQGILNETGRILLQKGSKHLGAFVAEVLSSAKGSSGEELAETLVSEVVTTFPAFQDYAVLGTSPVYLFKKALFLVQAIASTFGASDRTTAPSFPLPSTTDLPVFCDNVLPTMAIHYNLLSVSSAADLTLASLANPPPPSQEADKPTEGIKLTREQAFAIRAATVAACERTVVRAHELGSKDEDKAWLKSMTAVDLDGYLWSKAKDGELRKIPRLCETQTVFY